MTMHREARIISFEDIKKIKTVHQEKERIVNSSLEPDAGAAFIKKRLKERNLYGIFVDDYYSLEAIKLFSENIEKKLVTQKKDWLFLIENIDPNRNVPEINYFRKVASELGIKIKDPIIGAYTKEAAEKAGIKRHDAAVAYFIYNPQRYVGNESILIERISYGLRLNESEIRNRLEDLLKLKNLFPKEYEERRTKADRDIERLLGASKELSCQRLEMLLKKDNHNNLFVYTNMEYMRIFI